MAERIVRMSESFWNIRGSFKVAGMVDIGTQASLARLSSGKFVMLDAYTFGKEVARELLEATSQGADVEAIVHLHPFHTLHVESVARLFPGAKLFGTARHKARAPQLAWEEVTTDEQAFHRLYAQDFEFSVPRGVEFIPQNEHLHFSSVLATHRESRTLHVDDTLTWNPLPLVGGLMFHPTLKQVLHRREGAAAEFREWAHELIEHCEQVEHLCTAHARALPPQRSQQTSIAQRVRAAYARVQKVVDAHEHKYG